ncbi:hypothetical protein R1flu_029084 [Riccia fluitans]|uniref:SET domain-containing protein n=1 Tax=Riccia fluitans TaxID=41844 RepID=A0ABD1XRI4_9MARC
MPRRRGRNAKQAPAITDSQDLERKAEKALDSKNYKTAVELYSFALQVNPDNATVLGNRAKVYLQLEQYERAAADAEASLQLAGGQDQEARFSLAKALYGLRRYEEAASELNKLQSGEVGETRVSARKREIQELAESVECRIEEKVHGKYDLINMLKEAKETATPYLNHADFVGPVRVVQVEGKGKGMIATSRISAGTLILCCKAYAMVFEEERKLAGNVTVTDGTYDELLVSKVIEKMERQPGTVADVYSLFSGADMPALDDPPEATLQIDSSRVKKIVTHCAFQPYHVAHLWEPVVPLLPNGRITGLWILPSFLNHSCLANARQNFIGDFLFVRAMNVIEKGEEISLSYCDPFLDQTSKDRLYGFLCQCSLCSFAREHPEMTKVRSLLTRRFERLKLLIKMVDYSVLPELRQVIRSLRRSFEDSTHSDSGPIPLELYEPLMAESNLFFFVGRFEEAVNPLLEGFELLPRIGNGASNALARTDIAWRLRDIYKKLGKSEEIKKWRKRAREEFKVMFGDCEKVWKMYVEDYDRAHASPMASSMGNTLNMFMSLMALQDFRH